MSSDQGGTFGRVADAKYVQLTTFRRNGAPVASPLWAAVDGDRLYMWTVTDSWKVKRIRHDSRVIVQGCDVRGHKLIGDPVHGVAEILDPTETEKARQVIARKYGIAGWVTVKGSLLRRGRRGTVGLAITPTPGV